MTTTETVTTLEPQQFIVARALAGAFSHLWSGVPDGTYNIADIWQYSHENQHPSLPAGIYTPDVFHQGSLKVVSHTTGTGRLEWEVYEGGNVLLKVNRPNGQVLWVSMAKDGQEFFNMDTDFSFGAAFSFLTDETENGLYDNTLNPDFSERHVAALIRPIVALLQLQQEYHYDDASSVDEHEQYQNYIRPIIAQVKQYLKPLFDLALPDAFVQYDDNQNAPTTYWVQKDGEWDVDPKGEGYERKIRFVHHNGDTFPVESEKTAVHAVLLLRKYPDMSLFDAIHIAIISGQTRLGYRCFQCGAEFRPSAFNIIHCDQHEHV